MKNGTVRHFNEAGFGEIVSADGPTYFVHYTSIIGYPKNLKAGQKVSFDEDLSGKMAEAVNVRKL